MSSNASAAPRAIRPVVLKIHRWLSIGAAAFWMMQAITGVLLSFHFEIEDALLSTEHRQTELDSIEQRMVTLTSAEPNGQVNWIWTTAGLPDRYVINYTDNGGVERMARVNGDGIVQRDRAASDHSFLSLMRELHLNLLSGNTGYWLLAGTGVLLITNIFLGLIAAWPRRGSWRRALTPSNNGGTEQRVLSWHRAVGLWAIIPALIVVLSGTLIFFEHKIEDAIGVKEVHLAANPPEGPGVGFAIAARAAVQAIPNSEFVGTTMPSGEDASYYAWVRAPGELFRAYGASLVIVDANDGSVRGAYPGTDLSSADTLIRSLYPIHTGEFAGLPGRIIVMGVGIWLATMIILGVILWFKRRKRKRIDAQSSVST